jgi:plastocyanin
VEVQMNGRRRLTVLLAAGALFAIPLVGCGDDDDEGETEAATEAATEATSTAAAGGGGGETVDISATDFAFAPSDPTVKAGTVTFNLTNDGQAPHNLEVEGPSGEAELEQDLAGGESGQLTVDLSEPGTYEMYCPVGNHREMGMEGEITVR